jgi:hypothetical protein
MVGLSNEILQAYLSALKNPDFEPGYDDYREALEGLNRVCMASGEPIEGNLFFPCTQASDNTPPTMPHPGFREKRRDYATYALSGQSMLEIGFNAGHSALLALTINPNLKYLGIDYGNHSYTRPCFEYLRNLFGHRVDLWIGDSRELVPTLRHSPARFDLFHIDGGHDFGVAYADLCTVIDLCSDNQVILFDDTKSGVPHWLLDEICDFAAIRGLVSRVEAPTLWKSPHHILLKVNKRV